MTKEQELRFKHRIEENLIFDMKQFIDEIEQETREKVLKEIIDNWDYWYALKERNKIVLINEMNAKLREPK